MRRSGVQQGRQGRARGGRPRQSLQPGPPVSALRRRRRDHEQRQTAALPHEARPRRPREGRVGTHRLGRGLGHRRGPVQRVQSEVRRGKRGVRSGHGTRHSRLHIAFGLVVRKPQLLLQHRPAFLLCAAHPCLPAAHGLVLGGRLLPAICRPLRQSRVGGARGHSHLGQRPAGGQFRRGLRPLGGGLHAARFAHPVHRSAPDLACRQRGGMGAAAARHRSGRCPGHGQRHHRGGFVRPRFRRTLGLRFRRVRRTREGLHSRACGRDRLGVGRCHTRGGPHVRQRRTRARSVGRGTRPA